MIHAGVEANSRWGITAQWCLVGHSFVKNHYQSATSLSGSGFMRWWSSHVNTSEGPGLTGELTVHLSSPGMGNAYYISQPSLHQNKWFTSPLFWTWTALPRKTGHILNNFDFLRVMLQVPGLNIQSQIYGVSGQLSAVSWAVTNKVGSVCIMWHCGTFI